MNTQEEETQEPRSGSGQGSPCSRKGPGSSAEQSERGEERGVALPGLGGARCGQGLDRAEEFARKVRRTEGQEE